MNDQNNDPPALRAIVGWCAVGAIIWWLLWLFVIA